MYILIYPIELCALKMNSEYTRRNFQETRTKIG